MIRNTKQRRMVLALMQGNYTHPTADEVYEIARSKEERISRGTVYRVLNALTEEGEVRRLTMPYGPDHFEPKTTDHYHFVCRKCYKVVDLNIPYYGDLDETPKGLEAYSIERHRLILEGLCPKCK